MRTSLQVLETIHVANPCPASWDGMPGTSQVRFCGECNQSVFNLSTLTADEAAKVVSDATGRLCIRFYQRADGTMITKDCSPFRIVRQVRRTIYRAGMACASLLGFAFAIVGCSSESEKPHSTMGKTAPTDVKATMGKPAMMGGIAPSAQPQSEPAKDQKSDLNQN